MKIKLLLRNLLDSLNRRSNPELFSKASLPPDALVPNQDFDLSKPPPCPACKTTDVAKIVYGKPALTRQVLEGLESGRIISGGCQIHNGAPGWHCNRCNQDFARRNVEPAASGDNL